MLRLLCGAFLISFSAVFVKLVQVGPTATMFYRFLFGGLGLLLVVIIRREALWRGRQAALLGFMAGAVFTLDLFFWHRCILYVGPGLATILANFQVFSLAVIGRVCFKEPLRWQFIVAVPLAFVGLFMIVGINVAAMAPLYRLGILFGLLAAGCYTALTLILHASRRIRQPLSPNANMVLVCLCGAMVGSLEVAAVGETFILPDLRSTLLLAAYGLVCSGLGWTLISGGLATVSASVAGLALILQPTCAFVWDMLFFNRPTTTVQIAGAVLTLTAIYMGTITRAKN